MEKLPNVNYVIAGANPRDSQSKIGINASDNLRNLPSIKAAFLEKISFN